MGARARRWGAVVAAGAVAAATAVGTSAPAGAAVITVTTTVDGGAGSLRDAFAQASAAVEPTEIVLQDGATYELTDCAEGDLAHTGTQPLTITGNGATISQTCAGERVIDTDGDLTVVEATITGGSLAAGIGGGIAADTAAVSLVRSSVVGNAASSVGGGIAAIRVTLDSSTVSGNTAGGAGGGIWVDQVADLVNSTVSGNTAASGGGIAVVNTAVELLFATVAGNSASVGAAIELQPGSDDLISYGSVVAGDGPGADCAIDPGASTTSAGANVDGDGTCGFGAGADDQPGVGDPGLGALGANGGPTATRVPASGSPLLDGADCAGIAEDQRGVARPQGARCDVGAVEVEAAAPPPPPPPVEPPAPSPAPPAVPVPGPARFTG
ncbi:hypothetical protein HC251_20275 [Iamia sp. SCSIO 61187]|uniref:choice-of-anchor Q domain-containing protein n=1 Tax=Iamia sp. SCSIO 61187 TaxID=2722752 RepID=UPI001C629B15|nr:choice-of-anchor Q domain-containing protein [Iamia sp. SCSIO 61187]QYG94534.1 hypothetical protein HC251_20275 [Iamia sp. SCSIO 61187]